MNTINQFLERYLNFTPPALVRSRAISKALYEKFGIECAEGAISIRGDIALIRAEGSLKSEIVLHKQELLLRIKELGGGTLSNLA